MHDPEITRLLEQVMDERTVGDPMSPLKWNELEHLLLDSHGGLMAERLRPAELISAAREELRFDEQRAEAIRREIRRRPEPRP
jgi:hypothetical protein